MDTNQLSVHGDQLSIHTDSIVHPFLNDNYICQDDLDGSGKFRRFRMFSLFGNKLFLHVLLIVDNSDDSCNDGPSKHAPLREQDRFLPIANIAKIMKRAIPDNGKVSGVVQDNFNIILLNFKCCIFR